MAAKRRPRAPRLLLIYCEGKTEEEYFNILLDFYRLPAYVEVAVFGQKGQHIALIDNVAAKRHEFCGGDVGLSYDEVECWAVCDEDKMPCTYAELRKYGEDRDVRLAFSAPQFEMYLLQHFEQSGEASRDVVFEKLSDYRRLNGGEGDYDDSTKSDLAWISTAIDCHPKIVKTAIANSDIRDRAAKRPFLTVQELTKRIVELSI